MYKYIEDFLKNNGYLHYEVSNYSKEGYQSIHNLNYWDNGFYYGFGLGSVSYLDFNRISNTKNLNKYINKEYIDSNIYEDKDARVSNGLILGLRKIEGININKFNQRYNVDILKLYNIKELLQTKKLIIEDGNLKINNKFFYTANDILVNFI